jgi:hypothetical protein
MKRFVANMMAVMAVLVLSGIVQAQIPGIKNTPLDTDTWKNVDPTNKNGSAGKMVDSAMGGRYEVTLVNRTTNPIAYSVNGQSQIALLPGYRITHRGTVVGKAQVKFDIGAGDGTFRNYNVSSGNTYHFKYFRQEAVGASSGGSFLDLFTGEGTAPQKSTPTIHYSIVNRTSESATFTLHGSGQSYTLRAQAESLILVKIIPTTRRYKSLPTLPSNHAKSTK